MDGAALRNRIGLIACRLLLVVIVLVILVYVGDDLFVRYRLGLGMAGDPLETVTVHYATRLKNGKVEIFYDSSTTEVCARALFPHLGYRPCWYVRRTEVKLVGE